MPPLPLALIPALLLASPMAEAGSVEALVRVDGSGAQLLRATLVPDGLPRRSPKPVAMPGTELEVLDATGRPLDAVAIPDPRRRSVILPEGGGELATLEAAVARVRLPWPDGATELRLGAHTLRPRIAPPGTPVAVLESGDAEERLDMVFLGDGYTADQLDTFAADVDRMVAHMLATEPYGSYADLFNIWRVDRSSAESGVSHYDLGMSLERDTAYGCYYGCAGVDRLICCDDSAVMGEVSDSVPGADGIMVLVNDPTYGGSGGYNYATSYTAGVTGQRVAVHELGHSLVGLGDEYDYGAHTSSPPLPNCAEDPEDPPWTAWMDEAEVSAFAVCGYRNHHRPTEHGCMMRTLQDDYCVVCREQAVLAVHGALPGLVMQADPPPGVVGWGEGERVDLQVRLVGEDPDRFALSWQLEGEELGTARALELPGCEVAGESGASLELLVSDTTAFVRSDPDRLLDERLTWELLPCGAAGEDTGDPGGDDGVDSGRSEPDPGVRATSPPSSEEGRSCGCSAAPSPALAWILSPLVLVRRRR